MTQHQPDPVALLRAAGEDRAADLLVALKPTEAAEDETPETPAPPTPQVTAMNQAEAERQAEGRAVLEAMKRAGILDKFETETTA